MSDNSNNDTEKVPPLNLTAEEALVLYSALDRELDAAWPDDEDYEQLKSLREKAKRIYHSVDTASQGGDSA